MSLVTTVWNCFLPRPQRVARQASHRPGCGQRHFPSGSITLGFWLSCRAFQPRLNGSHGLFIQLEQAHRNEESCNQKQASEAHSRSLTFHLADRRFACNLIHKERLFHAIDQPPSHSSFQAQATPNRFPGLAHASRLPHAVVRCGSVNIHRRPRTPSGPSDPTQLRRLGSRSPSPA